MDLHFALGRYATYANNATNVNRCKKTRCTSDSVPVDNTRPACRPPAKAGASCSCRPTSATWPFSAKNYSRKCHQTVIAPGRRRTWPRPKTGLRGDRSAVVGKLTEWWHSRLARYTLWHFVRPSVRPSVVSRSFTKTAQRRITQTRPHSSLWTLVL